ncbi:MAG: flagellin [Hyphomicrobiales bacterium]
MAIKGIGTHGSTAYINRINRDMSDLHVQLSTGKKAQTYGLMGNDRNISLKMRADTKLYSNYNEAIKRANIHLGSVQNVLTSINDIEQNARADFNGTAVSLHDGSFENVKIGAKQRLNDAISLMNENISGRYLFSGTKLDEKPVESLSNIINGDSPRDGLKTYISERYSADMGALDNGRLTVATVGNQVDITEDSLSASPFGLKLANITQNVTGLASTGPVGDPAALGIDFTLAVPVEGEAITLKFNLPDGSTSNITISAKTDGTSDKEGFVIDVDPAITAANFQTSVNEAIAFLAKGEMRAASAAVAADGFFAHPPVRVDGTPLETAVAVKDGTTADTMSWYNGDLDTTNARDSFKVHASKFTTLSIGTRADEEPLRNFVKNMALMVAEEFDPSSAESNAHYGALKTRITAGLSDNNTKTSVLELATELGYKEKHLENLNVRNTSRVQLSLNIISDVEDSDTYEVSAQLLELKTQLEMSYKTTSLLSQVHLINFI